MPRMRRRTNCRIGSSKGSSRKRCRTGSSASSSRPPSATWRLPSKPRAHPSRPATSSPTWTRATTTGPRSTARHASRLRGRSASCKVDCWPRRWPAPARTWIAQALRSLRSPTRPPRPRTSPTNSGTLALARLAPGTASSEFFFNLSDNPELDTGAGVPGRDGFGYATFGRVLRGLGVLDVMQALPADGETTIEQAQGQVSPVSSRDPARLPRPVTTNLDRPRRRCGHCSTKSVWRSDSPNLAACRTWGGGAVTRPTWCWVGGGWGESRTPVRDWRR